MAKRLVTFEVDDGALFDAVQKMSGDCSAISQRVVETLLPGDAGFRTALGMAVYGIVLVPSPSRATPATSEQEDRP